ncbi:TIGR02444 family protein [Alteromonas antoniana]|uniref:TIGR02444 family protein n=1 Tax=Alteromonas antoniana TaxID=2803813 RepID=UPI001C45F5C1|nr:TIGR02444 family protein [Alteromonas antoniana]
MPASLTQEAFWQYSVRLYEREDVASHCLSLQDNYQVNVNLLLLVCWCMKSNAIVTLPAIQSLSDAIKDIDNQLLAHRGTRRACHPDNGGDKALYDELKSQELELEKRCQQVLAEAFNAIEAQQFEGDAVNPSIVALIHFYGLKNRQDARASLTYLMTQAKLA